MTAHIDTTTDDLEQSELDQVVGGLSKVGTGVLVLADANTYGATADRNGIIAI